MRKAIDFCPEIFYNNRTRLRIEIFGGSHCIDCCSSQYSAFFIFSMYSPSFLLPTAFCEALGTMVGFHDLFYAHPGAFLIWDHYFATQRLGLPFHAAIWKKHIVRKAPRIDWYKSYFKKKYVAYFMADKSQKSSDMFFIGAVIDRLLDFNRVTAGIIGYTSCHCLRRKSFIFNNDIAAVWKNVAKPVQNI